MICGIPLLQLCNLFGLLLGGGDGFLEHMHRLNGILPSTTECYDACQCIIHVGTIHGFHLSTLKPTHPPSLT